MTEGTGSSALLAAIAQAEKYKRRAELYKAACKGQNAWGKRNYKWMLKRIRTVEGQRDQAIAACERQAASHEHDREMFAKREEQHRLALRPEPLPVCDPATCSSRTVAEPCSRMVDGVCVASGRVQG